MRLLKLNSTLLSVITTGYYAKTPCDTRSHREVDESLREVSNYLFPITPGVAGNGRV